MRWQEGVTTIERSDQLALAGLAAALVLASGAAIRAGRPAGPLPVSGPSVPAQISVHVVGEVTWPGMYVLPPGARLQDAILAAHGPTLIADLRRVNLASQLRDGDRVVVPRIIQPTYPFPPARRPGVREEAAPSEGERASTVNVNTATAADLERLPGIGPVLARRIVEHREAKGLFRRLDDLLEVQGIGPKLFRRLEPLLRLE